VHGSLIRSECLFFDLSRLAENVPGLSAVKKNIINKPTKQWFLLESV